MASIFDIQLETAKMFVAALSGELRVSEQRRKTVYTFQSISKIVVNGRIVLKGTCYGTPPSRGSIIRPINSIEDDPSFHYKVESVTTEKKGETSESTVILNLRSGSIPEETQGSIFVEVLQSSNFEKMAFATRTMGMNKKSIHARVLLGNEPMPPVIELNDFVPYKEKLNKYLFSSVVMALTHLLSLIQGPPGTGKTLVSAELALQHHKAGRKVLMTAKTNKAADVITTALINHIQSTRAPKELLKQILRLGVDEKISVNLKPFTLQHKIEHHKRFPELRYMNIDKMRLTSELENIYEKIRKIEGFLISRHTFASVRNPLAHIKLIRLKKRIEEIENELFILNAKFHNLNMDIRKEIIQKAPIIITTSYQCPHAEFNGILFDALIFDEASQATVPEAAMALLKLKNDGYLTIIGDHKQLGPIVLSDHTVLRTSIYDLLKLRIEQSDKTSTSNKKAMLALNKQYRMHDDIAEICRVLAYDNGLESADLDKTLKVDPSKLNGCWQDEVINPAHHVVFASTEDIATQETKDKNGSSINVKEAEVIENIVKRLEEVGVQPHQISIISAYRGQRELISSRMQRLSVGTVDSLQGDENDVVIFDITRDNLKGAIGFMKDAKRLNVAVSRARKKLIIVGNRRSLGNHVKNKVFLKFLKAVDKNIVVIPAPDITEEEIFHSPNVRNMPETKHMHTSVINFR